MKEVPPNIISLLESQLSTCILSYFDIIIICIMYISLLTYNIPLRLQWSNDPLVLQYTDIIYYAELLGEVSITASQLCVLLI